MIKIDLENLKNLELNINEYLTIFKIHYLSKDSDIPFTSTHDIITSLKEKEYLFPSDGLKLTNKAKKIINTEESDIDEIITYFKEVTGKRKTSSESPSNRKFIKDRLNQGYTVEDLKAVIDLKYKEWNNTSMATFIRIETLFNQTKFQKYIGEVESKKDLGTDIEWNNIKRI